MRWYANDHLPWIPARGIVAVLLICGVVIMLGLTRPTAFTVAAVPVLLTAHAAWVWWRRRSTRATRHGPSR